MPVSHIMGWPNGSHSTQKVFFGGNPGMHIFVQSNKLLWYIFTALFAYRHRWINLYQSWFGWIGFATPLFYWVIQRPVGGFIHISSLSTWAMEHKVLVPGRPKKMQWIKAQWTRPMKVLLYLGKCSLETHAEKYTDHGILMSKTPWCLGRQMA